MASKQLAVFTIGPVQSFIAASKKIEDLWSGSYLLSHLIRHALKELHRSGSPFEMIFPYIENKEDLDKKTEVASFPNRFTVVVHQEEAETAALLKAIEASVKAELEQIVLYGVDKTFGNRQEIQAQAQAQARNFLEVYWAFEPMAETFDVARTKVEQKIGALKNMKVFGQEEGSGFSCSLCKERDTLVGTVSGTETYAELKELTVEAWKARSAETRQQNGKKYGLIRDNEHMCGICLAKRLSKLYYEEKVFKGQGKFERYGSIQDIGELDEKESSSAIRYYGILIMDGDNMGMMFQGKNEQEFRKISKALNDFAATSVPAIVKKHKGTLVYAGGDDVFAFLPLPTALQAANELQAAFTKAVGGTASAGLAFVHKTAPLQLQIQKTRELEGQAKAYVNPTNEKLTKNALAIGRFARSGEITQTVVPWKNEEQDDIISILNSFISILETRDNSKQFIYSVTAAFSPLIGANPGFRLENADMFMTELKRVLKRSAIKPENAGALEEKVQKLRILHDVTDSTFSFLQLLKVMTAIKTAKGGSEIENVKAASS